jgi:hypothetical protein
MLGVTEEMLARTMAVDFAQMANVLDASLEVDGRQVLAEGRYVSDL